MNTVLKKWGINVPATEWYPEYLMKVFPDRVYFIDKFPLPVSQENGYKLDFFDAFFKEANNTINLRRKFMFTENKYINTLAKLWLYNHVFVCVKGTVLLTHFKSHLGTYIFWHDF